MEQLEAVVSDTVFRNWENGYTVLSVLAGKAEYTVVGTLPELAPGEQVLFSGEWTEHRTYGRQFRCSLYELRAPSTLTGIERYLGSGIISGIGPTTAALIVDHFGEDTLSVMADHPERLAEVRGIGRKRAAMIAESFQEQQETRQTMIFLQTYGISGVLAMKILKRYGNGAPEVIRNNPYQLCEELEGVGFKTADRIGLSLGIARDSADRIRVALIYVLQEAAASAGHLYFPEKDLCAEAASLLQVTEGLCRQHLTALLVGRRLIAETDETSETGERRIYLPAFWRAEKEVALRLRELQLAARPDQYLGAVSAVSAFEKKHGIHFSATQRNAILQALENGVFVITGGPGTGKTTIINCILELLSRENDTVLCAPTGRAAKRMTEATGQEAATIHRLLEYNGDSGSFSRNEENPLEADCVIADEASMIDLMLMRALLRAIEPGARLILVGDADQLPSVGPGNVLGDILESGQVPCVRLTDIFRQSEASRIVVNAHRINHGQMPFLNEKGTDFFFDRRPTAGLAAETVVALVTDRLSKYLGYPPEEAAARATREIQVLAPARKGECGVNTLNLLLQAALNPPAPGVPQLVWNETVYRLGDKVIQTRNDYQLAWTRKTPDGSEEGIGVFNGDIGFITEVNPTDHFLVVCFDEEKYARYDSDSLDHLEPAYCLSVHKSQGSEFPVVVLPVVSGPPMLLTRNLLYTALTRARNMVVLVGREEIIRQMTENDHEIRRFTTLTLRLRETASLMT